jgi:hypothetical protein
MGVRLGQQITCRFVARQYFSGEMSFASIR